MSRIDQLIQELCPDGVETALTGELAEIGTGKSDRKNAIQGGKYPFYVRSKEILEIDTYEFNETAIVTPGEGRIGEIFHLAHGKYALHQRAYRIHFIDERVNPSFALYYFETHFKQFILSKSVTATVASIRKPMLTEFPIPLPPLEIQQEIARTLDQFVELDKELEAEIEGREKQFKQLLHTLTESLSSVERVAVDEIFQVSRGRVISKDYLADNPGDYPVYSSQTQNAGVFGYIDNFDVNQESLTWTTDGVYAGSVFYHSSEEKFSITNVCGLLVQKDPAANSLRYLHSALGVEAKKYVSQGMGNPKLMSNTMKKVQIPLPPLEVQEEIALKLDTLTEYIDNLKRERELRQKQFEYYRDQLLDFGVKG